MQDPIPFPEIAKLCAESKRTRAQAIRLRIATGHVFCSVVESEARWESAEIAQASMDKVWQTIAGLKRHLAQPEHVPEESAGELISLMRGLEDRARRLQQSIALGGESRQSHTMRSLRPRARRTSR